ncbi:hypothetical protein HC928_18915 [bacterium]|nr:hypothetical protein [bacterium]
MAETWLNTVMRDARSIDVRPEADTLITKLLKTIDSLSLAPEARPLALGAAFDLLVLAEYYATVGHVGWWYCLSPDPHPGLPLYQYLPTLCSERRVHLP